MARKLGQDGFGAFTFASAVAIIFVSLASAGTDYVITREVAQESARTTDLVWSATTIKAAFGAAGVALALGFASLAGYERDVLIAVALVGVATLVEAFAKTFHSVLRGLHDTVPVAASLVIQRVGTALVGVPLLLVGADLVQICAVYLFGACMSLLWTVAVMARRAALTRPRLRRAASWSLLVASMPIALNEASGIVMSRIDVGILALISDDAAVGIYGAAYRLFESTLFLSWAFGLAALPAFAVLTRSSAPTLGQALEAGLKVTAVALLPIGATLVLFGPSLIELVYGQQYAEAAPVLQWLGPAAALYGFFTLPSYLLISQGLSWRLGAMSAAALVFNVVLNLLLVPSMDAVGAAISMAASQALLSAGVLAIAVRQSGRLDPVRIALGPLSGCAAMAGSRAILGDSGLGLVVAGLSFCVVLLVVEWFAYRDDVRKLDLAVRRRLSG